MFALSSKNLRLILFVPAFAIALFAAAHGAHVHQLMDGGNGPGGGFPN